MTAGEPRQRQSSLIYLLRHKRKVLHQPQTELLAMCGASRCLRMDLDVFAVTFRHLCTLFSLGPLLSVVVCGTVHTQRANSLLSRMPSAAYQSIAQNIYNL